MSSWLTHRGAGQTFGSRLRQYKRREQMIVWVGAGLVGVIAVFAAVEFTRQAAVPAVMPAIVPTLVILGAGFLALARVQFEWAATQLQRSIEDGQAQQDQELPAVMRSWPRLGEFCWRAQLWLTIAAAAALLVLIWWAALCGNDPL